MGRYGGNQKKKWPLKNNNNKSWGLRSVGLNCKNSDKIIFKNRKWSVPIVNTEISLNL